MTFYYCQNNSKAKLKRMEISNQINKEPQGCGSLF